MPHRPLLQVALLLLGLLVIVSCWDIDVTITREASGAVGGEPFAVQPSVAVRNKKGVLQTSILGTVSAELADSPTGYEVLQRVGDEEDGDGDGRSRGSYSVDVVEGVATFAGLYVNEAGYGYHLRYIFRDEYGLTLGFIDSDTIFEATRGDPYQISVTANPGRAYGGNVFGDQPVVGMKDRGGNHLTDVNTGQVSVELIADSTTTTTTLLHAEEGLGDTVPIENGLAVFHGLYIKDAGLQYKLRFATNLPLLGATICESTDFSVGVGPAHELVIAADASNGTVTGGRAFPYQPRIEVMDAGGNVLNYDYSSSVKVEIHGNPADGALTPEHGTLTQVVGGVAQFENLSIDRVGVGYRLLYTLFEPDEENVTLVRTDVHALGDWFNVGIGNAHGIDILREPTSSTWAGNQPFVIQPRIGLVDAGGNVIATDSETAVHAYVTPSLAVSSHIVIDTTNDPVPTVSSVSFANEEIISGSRSVFGSGDVLSIEIMFSQEVIVEATTSSTSDPSLPSLELNVIDNEGAEPPTYAHALLRAESIGMRTKTLRFDYVVQPHHSSRFYVNYVSPTTSLNTNDYTIKDAFARDVAVELPPLDSISSLAASREIHVDRSPAFIERISSEYDTGDFEFGAGQVIDFQVQFSREVAVQGSPRIPLNVRSTLVLIETVATVQLMPESYFLIEYKGTATREIPWDASAEFIKFELERIATVKGEVCVSRSPSASTHGFRWAIRVDCLFEDSPSLDLFRVDSDGMREGITMGVSIQTISTPVLDWSSDGGDPHMCAGRVATYKAGSGSSVLTFEYVSMQGDGVARLDVSSEPDAEIVLPTDEDVISPVTNNDSNDISLTAVPANLALGNNGLPVDVSINVDTTPPSVVRVTPSSATTPDGLYAVGDTLYFEIVFTKPVHVDTGLELLLATGGAAQGVARYDSGSGSDTLIMRYDVSEFEFSSRLNYIGPSALIARNGQVEGHIRQMSTIPATDAILDLPSIASGNTLADISDIVLDGARPMVVKVSFDEESQGKSFVEREEIAILIEFSAPVIVSGGPPLLLIVVGGQNRKAMYESGSGSALLRFVHTVMVGDLGISAEEFSYKRICLASACDDSDDQNGSIKRQSSNPSFDANLDLPSFGESLAYGRPIASDGSEAVYIDATDPLEPTAVVMVTTSHEAGSYGAGEELRLHVEFTDIVYITSSGAAPKLCTNLGSSSNFGVPYESGSGTNVLTFRHVVVDNDDSTAELAWTLCPGSDKSGIDCSTADDEEASCSIKNAIGNDANLSFGSVSPLDGTISIDTTAPSIVSVYTTKQRSQNCFADNILRPSLDQCIYTAGEAIDIIVTFDMPVVVRGAGLSLLLDVDASNGVKRYVHYDPEQSSASETDLVFTYQVQSGDTSNGESLTYVCEPLDCSLSLGPLDMASVLRKASYPIKSANLNLPPLPSPHGVSLDSENPIIIDATGVPCIVQVSSLSEDGIYAPGDVVQILVRFTEPVAVTGMPLLALDVGNKHNTIGAAAVFAGGSGSTDLIFEYTVGSDHISFDLDYIDAFSLNLDRYDDGSPKGSIQFASTNPTISANLLLPPPMSLGSLSVNSNIVIDSRAPHIVALTSSQSPGLYATGNVISILVQFSVDVAVTGSPYLLLETGDIDRRADFVGHVEDTSTTLEFQYTVQLGDESSDLDYWTDEGLVRSSVSSFQLNGGSIMRKSASPIVHADLHLNPGHGFLDGTTTISFEEGTAAYTDLKIGKRGNDYKIRFMTSSHVSGVELETTVATTTSVGLSSEYEVIGEPYNRDVGDHFGHSVAVDGDLLAVGAPGKRLPVPEVQVLTVLSNAKYVQNEVQIISTGVNVTEATKRIQSFTSRADPGEAVDGTFSLTYHRDSTYLYGTSIHVEAGVGAAELETILKEEFPMLGDILVVRTPNVDCSCTNAWTWTVTILDASSTAAQLDVDGTGLIGGGATMSNAHLVRDTAMINGSFYLVNPFNNAKSRDIFFDASDVSMKEVIEEDLGINVKSILVVDTDDYGREFPGLGRRWTITFNDYQGEFGDLDVNVPNLQVNGHGLTGLDAHVWSYTPFEGRAPLRGHFALSLRGSQFGNYIPHDASAETIKVALESLDSINTVSVSPRRDIGTETDRLVSGSMWGVTFHSINRDTDYGWVVDPGAESSGGNLPPLEVSSHLVGWNVTYLVEHEYGSGSTDTQAQWMAKSMGDAGLNSGAVYIHAKDSEQWMQESTIVASDHTSLDRFGHSVDLKGSLLLVGAPTKTVDGLPEQQALTCVGAATSGSFSLSFLGFSSDPIPYDATVREIETAIVGLYGETTRIHPLPTIQVEATGDWDGDDSEGVCGGSNDGREVLLTFITPDGGGISTEQETSADVEMMTIDDSDLVGGSLSMREVRKGTRSPMGVDLAQTSPTGKASGSVYLFQRLPSAIVNSGQRSWIQLAKFTPMDGFDDPTESAEFGWSVSLVSLGGDKFLVAIGSPGYANQSGRVYLFTGTGSGSDWSFHGTLTSRLWTTKSIPGDRFGETIHQEGDTILVGAPGHAAGRGAVFVFKQGNLGGDFLPSQPILGPPDVSPGSMFGHSLSLSENTAVICAPGANDSVVHAGHLAGTEPTPGVGSCYIYTRETSSSPFILAQKLVASNLMPADRFGYSVALFGSRLVVGQLQAFDDNTLEPPRPVQILQARCNVTSCADVMNPSIQLSWRSNQQSQEHQTRLLPINVSAVSLQNALEFDLSTDPVTVERVPSVSGSEGFNWTITFDTFLAQGKRGRLVPVLSCHTRDPNLECSVELEKGVPQKVRGKAHVFTQGSDGAWTEQAFLYPNSPQRQDMLGASVALKGDTTVLGAPNRETLNVASGSAFVHDLSSFLTIVFDSSESEVVEGDTIDIDFSREQTDGQHIVGIKSMERNANEEWQYYVDDLYSFQSSELIPLDHTSIDKLSQTTAFGWSHYYGSSENRSTWLEGMFDYRGISDFATIDEMIMLQSGQTQGSILFKSTDDHIYEHPDENITLQMHVPGIFASQLGNLTTSIVIRDNGDSFESATQKQYYSKLFGNRSLGTAIAIDDSSGIMIVGGNGKAEIFKKEAGAWGLMPTLSLDEADDTTFGRSVAIDTPYGRTDTTVLIGAPGLVKAFAYVFDRHTDSWDLQGALTPFDDAFVTSEHGFANSIAISGDLAFVSCASLETVYAFRRLYNKDLQGREWMAWKVLRSSEYDYDVYDRGNTVQHLHRQDFGAALAADRRTLLVGSPFSTYGNRGDTSVRENYNSDGVHNSALSNGKVFVFTSEPHVQKIVLQTDEVPRSGTFRLKLDNHPDAVTSGISGLIPHGATPNELKQALEEANNIGEVHVTLTSTFDRQRADRHHVSWLVSFISEVADTLPPLEPIWGDGNGCTDCETIQLSSLSTFVPQISVTSRRTQGEITEEESALEADDLTNANGFGTSLALDGNQAIVGAPYSAARSRTTWDFETGTLMGWSYTGSIQWGHQPTYGDNSIHHTSYKENDKSDTLGDPQSSSIEGRYYLGTYENWPSNETNYLAPDSGYPTGSIHGDELVGTLTSDPFIILGDSISFLVGGGCDHLTVFVELLVDGFSSTMRATGKCRDGMDRLSWDVSDFVGRSAQIRIVDVSTDKWGHINVNDIRFSWDIEGGIEGRRYFDNLKQKCRDDGAEKSPMAGVAYLFHRTCSPTGLDHHDSCAWSHQERIVASDKRENNLFGFSVDVDDERGIAVVGSVNSPLYGIYQETPSQYPHTHPSNGVSYHLSTTEDLEDFMRSGNTFSTTGGSIRVIDHIASENNTNKDLDEDEMYPKNAGAMYVFLRKYNASGLPYWSIVEDAKITPPDVAQGDMFGHSVSLDGVSAAVGAPGVASRGGAYFFDISDVFVRFSEIEYAGREGEGEVKIFIERDPDHLESSISIGYSVSDLTAKGKDSNKFNECIQLAVHERYMHDCGDYEQTSGTATFGVGVKQVYFSIMIMDDDRREQNIEYAQLILHVPGGGPVHGENYRAKLRIDDDD